MYFHPRAFRDEPKNLSKRAENATLTCETGIISTTLGHMKQIVNGPKEPLAPFNQADPFQLAMLAVMLSQGSDPAPFLPAAASLWAQAYHYRDRLWFLFYGDQVKQMDAVIPHVFSFGPGEVFMDVKKACATYSWGEKHLRGLLKAKLPPHIFAVLWKPPISTIQLPKTLLDRLAKLQAEKRIARARKAVKPA